MTGEGLERPSPVVSPVAAGRGPSDVTADMTSPVRLAIARTPVPYLLKVLGQRAHGAAGQAGSHFSPGLGVEAILGQMMMAEWTPYAHEAVAPGAAAFRCPIPGHVGVVHLSTLDPSTSISIVSPKGLPGGQAAVVVEAGPLPSVDFSVALVGHGAELGVDDSVLWTVHPGDPVRPTELPEELVGRVVPVAKARALGVEWVKIIQR